MEETEATSTASSGSRSPGDGELAPQLWTISGRRPTDAAIEDPRRRLTWAELEERTNAVGHGVESIGLQPGDHVALVAGNRVEFYEAMLGVQRAGMVVSPLKTGWTQDEIAYVLADAGTKLVIADTDAARQAARAAGIPLLDLDADWERWLEQQKRSPLPLDRYGRRMSYTSGTTGRPKGVVRNQGRMSFTDAFARSRQMAALLRLPGDGAVHLMVAALFHGAPLTFSQCALAAGAIVRILPRWDADAAIDALADGVASTTMVPTMFRWLLALPMHRRAALPTPELRCILHGGEPCPVELKRRMIDWWGPVFVEYYGSSEGGMTLATTEEWLAHPGTVGRPIGMYQCLVLDDQGRPLPPRRQGHIHFTTVTGERAFSYLNDPDKTESAYVGNAFSVGDIGWLDEDGYLYISGRIADVIVSAGVNVYPAEVEEVLASVDGIVDAAVVGGPDEERGETVVAVVVLGDGVDEETIRNRIETTCRQRLAAYQRPRRVVVRTALPRDATGKLVRRQLRDELWGGRSPFAVPGEDPSSASRAEEATTGDRAVRP